MNNKEKIIKFIEEEKISKEAFSTSEISKNLNMQRTNVSTILNDLCREGKLTKSGAKPVLYSLNSPSKVQDVASIEKSCFDTLIGSDGSLKRCIQQAKAAIMYPPHGLHTIIVGPTGVGKTLFAEFMYKFAMENNLFGENAPFEVFNCSDYANNPQLLISHLFGCKKGAFTGADKDKEGLVSKANGGVLFLDEVHRLPPEGQEMLFRLIDKGVYTPLGSTQIKKSELLIICATTENIDDTLLETFTRRIPINIKIPSLDKRGFEERFELICDFFRVEAFRLKKSITVSANTVRQLLLYDCPGNVGQLKSDIQLGCANAFLNSVSNNLENVEVHFADFPSYVNQGLILYKNYALEIDKLLKGNIEINIDSKEQGNIIMHEKDSHNLNIYEEIESKVRKLQYQGLNEDEIKPIIEIDIENYFKQYIHNFGQGIEKEELSKLVDKELIDLVESFLKEAGKKLKRVFTLKVVYGLCLHVNSSIARIKNNKKIFNYNLSNIKKNNKKEFEVSKELALSIEEKYNITVPEDEVGFIAMFLTVDSTEEQTLENRPIVVIAMHGRSTASSMAEVVNRLVGANNVYAYDMNLDKDPKIAYEELKNLIIKKNRGADVLLLTDMGSLNIYGELISKETNIEIRTMDMVSTLMAIECSRKAVVESDINLIYEFVKQELSEYKPETLKTSDTFVPDSENIIITLCTTGEGSAIGLKNFLENKINFSDYNTQILAMAFNNKAYTYSIINNLRSNKNILAIVGTINPNISGIPYISTYEIFKDKNCKTIKSILPSTNKARYNNIDAEEKTDYGFYLKAIEEEISNMNLNEFEKLYNEFLTKVQSKLNIDIEYDISVGLLMHMVSSISKLIAGERTSTCYDKGMLKDKYAFEFACIKESLKHIEEYYAIKINDDEIAFILRIIIKM